MGAIFLRVLVIGILLSVLSVPARSETTDCDGHAELQAHLAHEYAEVLIGIGVGVRGNVMELYRSRAGTWTLVISYPNGLSCMVAAGNNWQEVEFVDPGKAT